MITGPNGADQEAVKRGFSAMAAEYDAMAETNRIVKWMRTSIRALVEAQLTPAGSILEINAGSGLDAAYFARKGYHVHATDVAPGMLDALRVKAATPELGGRLTVEALSFTDLSSVSGGPYDLVFSNLGGLNCIEDLTAVTRHFSEVVRPGGVSVLVLMPRICPWEIALTLKGIRHVGLRRFSRNGTIANVAGEKVPVWYHSVGKLERALGREFETVGKRSFCVFCPPSYFSGFAERHPRVIDRLTAADDRLGPTWPFRQGGDFYALVSRRTTS